MALNSSCLQNREKCIEKKREGDGISKFPSTALETRKRCSNGPTFHLGAFSCPILISTKRRWKKNCTNSHPKKKGGGGRKRPCPALCEVCLRPSAISADVTHAVGVADMAPTTEHAEASLFAPVAVVVAVLAWRQKHACSRHLDSWIFSFDFEFQLTLVRCSSFMLAHG